MSKRKGARGELELAHALKAQGIEARRGRQYAGHPDAPDVVTALPGVHFEVKRRERFSIHQAMTEACADAGPTRVPVVAHRRNRGEWLLTLRLADFVRLSETCVKHRYVGLAPRSEDAGRAGAAARAACGSPGGP